MSENKAVIDIKRERIKEELRKENPNKLIIRRLKESIRRHKKIGLSIHYNRLKNWKKRRK